jgi:hypothetical protein
MPQQILERTQSQRRVQHIAQQPASESSYAASGPSDEPPARTSTDPLPIRRIDSTVSSKLTKDKDKK